MYLCATSLRFKFQELQYWKSMSKEKPEYSLEVKGRAAGMIEA